MCLSHRFTASLARWSSGSVCFAAGWLREVCLYALCEWLSYVVLVRPRVMHGSVGLVVW